MGRTLATSSIRAPRSHVTPLVVRESVKAVHKGASYKLPRKCTPAEGLGVASILYEALTLLYQPTAFLLQHTSRAVKFIMDKAGNRYTFGQVDTALEAVLVQLGNPVTAFMAEAQHRLRSAMRLSEQPKRRRSSRKPSGKVIK